MEDHALPEIASIPTAKESQGSSEPRGHAEREYAKGRPASVQGSLSTSVASSPLSSTPNTPALPPARPAHSRRTSHNGTLSSPKDTGADTPVRSPVARRTSGPITVRQGSASSPGLRRQGSRTSLGGTLNDNIGENAPTPKRSISNLISGLREAQAKMEPIEEPKIVTAADIATEHFIKELEMHADASCNAPTTVVLQDACYGHRFSRPKTTRSHLSMIVERPERLNAAVLGSAAAYVRLGEHHAEGFNAPHPNKQRYAKPPFKIRRTSRSIDITNACVTNVHGTAWMSELKGMCDRAGGKLAAGEKELGRASTAATAGQQPLHEGDLYLCSESLAAFEGALGGVADAIDTAFTSDSKRTFVGIRPPGHHCSSDHPSGFCWINNVHVGIEYAALSHGLTHAVILDFDLHHGDGSQAIAWTRNKQNGEKRQDPKRFAKQRMGPEIGYYSLHDINSYPCEDGDDSKVQAASLCIDNAHDQSVWNVHLQPWKTEDDFWLLYETRYRVLLDKARSFLQHHTARYRAEGKVQPKAVVFISAGFDASEWEGAGMQRHKVNVPTEFYAKFTKDCVALAEDLQLGCDGRVVSVLEGGYSDRALCSGVLSHLSGLCASSRRPSETSAFDIEDAMNGLSLSGTEDLSATNHKSYQKLWWSETNLASLEGQVLPPPPTLTGKKHRVGTQPTYATPTESFAYKVRDTDKFARSISGTLREGPVHQRSKTPPPPEVDWVIATQELHRLLVPQDRQTTSNTAEDLAPVRTKKERQSAMPALGSADTNGKPAGRQLRERALKTPAMAVNGSVSTRYDSAMGDDGQQQPERERSVSRSERRQTVHGWTPAKATTTSEQTIQDKKSSRRSSLASTYGPGSVKQEAEHMPPPPPPASRIVGGHANGVARLQSVKTNPASNAVNARKPRDPARPVATKKAAVRKTSASAPVSPLHLNKAAASTSAQSAIADTSFPPGLTPTIEHEALLSGSSTDKGVDNVDTLTSGLKKISLKVGTREESERKAKEKLDAERRARALKAAETRKRNAEAKKQAAAKSTAGPGTTPRKSAFTHSIGPNGDGTVRAPAPSNENIGDAAPALPEWARVATNQMAEATSPQAQTLKIEPPAQLQVLSFPQAPPPNTTLPQAGTSNSVIKEPDIGGDAHLNNATDVITASLNPTEQGSADDQIQHQHNSEAVQSPGHLPSSPRMDASVLPSNEPVTYPSLPDL